MFHRPTRPVAQVTVATAEHLRQLPRRPPQRRDQSKCLTSEQLPTTPVNPARRTCRCRDRQTQAPTALTSACPGALRHPPPTRSPSTQWPPGARTIPQLGRTLYPPRPKPSRLDCPLLTPT